MPYVLQPAQPRLGGTFTVQGNIGPFTFECSCVAGPPNSDALIVVGSTNETGSLQIQYTAEGVPPVNVSFDYSKCAVYHVCMPCEYVLIECLCCPNPKPRGLQNLCIKQGEKLKPSSIDRLLMQSPQHYYKPLELYTFLILLSWCKDSLQSPIYFGHFTFQHPRVPDFTD